MPSTRSPNASAGGGEQATPLRYGSARRYRVQVFDAQPTLIGAGVRLRPLQPSDRGPLYDAASDPLIWEQHPSSDRYEAGPFGEYFDVLLATATATPCCCSRSPVRPGPDGPG